MRYPAPIRDPGVPDIRPLRPSDSLDELTALLHRAYARLAALGLNYTAVDQTAEVTARRIEGGTCFVAVGRGTFAGALVGTIVVQPPTTPSPCAYYAQPHVASVHQFAVEPSLQGLGLGRALLARTEAWAAENGYGEIALDTAEPAVHLTGWYERLGWRVVGTTQWRGKVYRSVVMSKAVAT